MLGGFASARSVMSRRESRRPAKSTVLRRAGAWEKLEVGSLGGRPSGNDTPLGPVQEGFSSSLIMMELHLFSQRFSDLEPD